MRSIEPNREGVDMVALASTPTAELKAAGRLVGVSLNNLNGASLDPADVAALEDRFCSDPDFVDREIVETEEDVLARKLGGEYESATVIGANGKEVRFSDAIQQMHRRQFEATGRGSWPPGQRCHAAQYPHEGYHATILYIESDAFLRNSSLHREVTDDEWTSVVINARVWPSVDNPVQTIEECKRLFSYDSQDPRVRAIEKPWWKDRSSRRAGQPYTVLDMSTWLAIESTRRAGCLMLEVDTGPNGTHNIHEKMIPIPGSTSGFAYFNDATCTDHVTSNIDSGLTYSLGRITGLRTHEFGHNNNLQHQFRNPQSAHRSIMSYAQDNTPFQGYRLGVAPYFVNSIGNAVEDHSWEVLRRFYGGEAARPVEGDIIVPTRPNLQGVLEGRFNGTVYVVEGEIVIPEGAVGGTYIMQRLGENPNEARHVLIPKAEV